MKELWRMRHVNTILPWIGLIGIIALLIPGPRLSPLALLLGLGGGIYLLYQGWQIMNGREINTEGATYWRGRRIEVRSLRRRIGSPWRAIAPAAPHLVIGSGLVLVVLAMLMA